MFTNLNKIIKFIDNDPTEKLLKFMAEKNEKQRKHKTKMMKLMFSQPHPPFQELSSSILFHYHSPLSSGNWSLFQQIPYHLLFSKFLIIKIMSMQKEYEIPRTRFLSAMCYKHHPLQSIFLLGLPIKKHQKKIMYVLPILFYFNELEKCAEN